MGTSGIIVDYYQSLRQKDDRWQNMYTEGESFSDASGTLNAQGKSAVIQSFIPFLRGVSDFIVQQIIEENERACAIVDYVYINSEGEKMDQSVADD